MNLNVFKDVHQAVEITWPGHYKAGHWGCFSIKEYLNENPVAGSQKVSTLDGDYWIWKTIC